MKILILGHNGLLGNMVYKYFKSQKYNIVTTDLRWDNNDFKKFIKSQKIQFIINCIGIIPQRNPDKNNYDLINYELPVWLDSLGVKVIHPDTDEDDSTPYGLSKKKARKKIIFNTKILKTSIIGMEKNTSYSFLEWFLNSTGEVNGYFNQYWNGITTLEWAKWAEKLMLSWGKFKNITILENPECVSKYELLLSLKRIFEKDIKINMIELDIEKNSCQKGGTVTKDLMLQLIEMKYFYKNNNSEYDDI